MYTCIKRAVLMIAGLAFATLAGAESLVEITLVDKLDDERGRRLKIGD